MTVEDLILIGKEKVRSDAHLLTTYKMLFKEKFGREPDCAGCTFNHDWVRLTNQTTTISNYTIMANTTFDIINKGKIYSYDIFDKKTDRTKRVRSYGNVMTEDFANAYLTNGTAEEIAARKKEFRKLPESFIEDTEDITKLTVKQLKEMAADAGYPEDEYGDLKKADLIAYIEAKSVVQD